MAYLIGVAGDEHRGRSTEDDGNFPKIKKKKLKKWRGSINHQIGSIGRSLLNMKVLVNSGKAVRNLK